MNPNIQMLITYLNGHLAFLNKGGTIRMSTPPGGVSREQRRLVERACPKLKFNWANTGVVDGVLL